MGRDLFEEIELSKFSTEYGEINSKWLWENKLEIDWTIEERNKVWHDTYFTRQAVKDHQAKGNCRLAWLILCEMESCDLLYPGDIVVDHMCGIGSFLLVAALRGYNAFGVELEDVFYLDMVGYDSLHSVDENDDLFYGFSANQHVEGNIERFNKLLGNRKRIGSIRVVQGDARRIDEILQGEEFLEFVGSSFGGVGVINSPPYSRTTEVGGGMAKSRTQHYSPNIAVVNSPPYGNRLRDEGQQFGAKDKRTWSELGDEIADNKQYSLNPDNIGNAKIAIVNSPPYSRSTEHDDAQIEAMPEQKKTGHQGFKYEGATNIALLDVDPYRHEMRKVYLALHRALPSESPVALITRNFVQEGQIVYLDKMTINMMKSAGFQYLFTKRAVLPEISFFKYINWQKMHKEKGLPLITWEEVTFYIK